MMMKIPLAFSILVVFFHVCCAETAPSQGTFIKRVGCKNASGNVTSQQQQNCRSGALRAKKFNIDLINFSNSSDYNHLFIAAAERWEEIITEDTIPGTKNYVDFDLFDGIFGNASAYKGPLDDLVIGFQMLGDEAFDNPLAAGRSAGIFFNDPDPERMTPPIFPMSGAMVFNLDAFARHNATENDILLLIMHEMGHILGIGSEPWIRGCTPNCVNITDEEYGNFTLGSDGYYCARAHRAYNKLSIVGRFRTNNNNNKNKRQLLVNQLGDLGSVCSHWAEESFNVPGITSELMTPFFENNVAQPISTVTLGALEDIGYSVDYSKADDFPQQARRGKKERNLAVFETANNINCKDNMAKSKKYYPISPDTTFSTLDWVIHSHITPKCVSLGEVRRRV